MKIGIDARCLESEQRGGVARYLVNMLKLWPQMSNRHRFKLYFDNHIPDDDFLKQPLFEFRVIMPPRCWKLRRTLAEQILMPNLIRRDRLDLFFAPWYYAPLYCPCPKTVVAAWDISYTTHKGHFNPEARFRLSFLSRNSCRRAAGVITCSSFDARQIQQYYGIPSERICILKFAADDKFKPPNGLQKLGTLRRKYHLPERYILSLGVIFNRRNVDVIIDAFKDVYRDYPDMGLVVVGRNETVPFLDIEGRIKPLIEEGRGLYLYWIPEDELVDIYSGAWYYICTSTADGEAIMLKEAMRCGTPVITSPLLEEAMGGAGVILDDPTSRQETAELFRRVIPSYELRERYRRQGLEWAQALSWTKAAEDTLHFLESR